MSELEHAAACHHRDFSQSAWAQRYDAGDSPSVVLGLSGGSGDCGPDRAGSEPNWYSHRAWCIFEGAWFFAAGRFSQPVFWVSEHVQVKQVDGEVQGIDVQTTLVRTVNGTTVIESNWIMCSQILNTRCVLGMHRFDLSKAAIEINAGGLARIGANGISESSVAVWPAPTQVIVPKSCERTESTVCFLIFDPPENRQTMIHAVYADAGDHGLESTVS
ncbi:MAG TPA: hypothetical protein VEW66_04245 [Thermomicrobiales bacterium]|nr:hypothetical protein [Thermomicrobiales bacterium]